MATPRTSVIARTLLVVGGALLAACGEAQWKPPTTDAEIDAAARRGDSMARQIEIGRALADTLARITAGELDPSLLGRLGSSDSAPLPAAVAVPSADPTSGGTGAAMTARAIARADSMSRADAKRTLEAARARAAELESAPSTARGARPAGARSEGDTLRGIITLEGAPPAARVTIVSEGATMPTGLSGMAVSALLKLDGLEVTVRGVRAGPRELAVTSFTVRAIDGIPVADGVLQNDGGAWSLREPDGERRALSRVPVQLQPYVGSRVWLALQPGASPGYGVISRR